MRRIETAVLEEWLAADDRERFFPHEFMSRSAQRKLKKHYQIDPPGVGCGGDGEKLPIFVPGWEIDAGEHVLGPIALRIG